MNAHKILTKRNAYIAIAVLILCALFGIKINKRMQLNAEIATEEQVKIDEVTKKEAGRAFQQEMSVEMARKLEKEAEAAERDRLLERHFNLDMSQRWEIESYIDNTGARACLIKSPAGYIKRMDNIEKNAAGIQLVLVKDTDGSITVGIQGKGVGSHISTFSYNTSNTGIKINEQYLIEFDAAKNTPAFNLLAYSLDKSMTIVEDFKDGGFAKAYVRLTNGSVYEAEGISLSDFEYAYSKLKTCR